MVPIVKLALRSPQPFDKVRGLSTNRSFTGELSVKRTFQPHNLRRLRVHGFRARMATPGGRNVIKLRRSKGRKRLAPSTYSK